MFVKWCKKTSCNGIIHLYESRTKKFHFAFWLVVMLTMFGASVYFTYKAIQGYVDTPYVTTLETVSNGSLFLPEILIKYNGGFDVSVMEKLNFSQNFIHSFAQLSFMDTDYMGIPYTSNTKEFTTYIEKYNLTISEAYSTFGYKCRDLVKMFLTQSISNRCQQIIPLPTFHGNAYAFKDNDLQIWPSEGVYITLTAPSSSYVYVYSNLARRLDFYKTFSIIIDKKLDDGIVGVQYEIPVNYKTTIILNPTFYKRIPTEVRCDKTDYSLGTSDGCLQRCQMYGFISCTKCVLVEYSKIEEYSDAEVCPPFLRINCNFTAFEECALHCKPKCQEWKFNPTITSIPLEASSANQPELAYVQIYYNSFQYTKIEEVTSFTYDMAIANVGGQSGLWLGISIISIIEAIYYTVIALTRTSQNRQDSNSNEQFIQNGFENELNITKEKLWKKLYEHDKCLKRIINEIDKINKAVDTNCLQVHNFE